jgi:hypothetical protein
MRVEHAKVEKYDAYLKDLSRPPSKGGNTQARHLHVLTINGERYSFLAAGTKRWAYKSDTISFDWQWDKTGKYRNIAPESVTAWDGKGNKVARGNFDWKPLRTAPARLPGSRRERRD